MERCITIRSVSSLARVALYISGLSEEYWSFAVVYAGFVKNLIYDRSLDASPHFKRFQDVGPVHLLKCFGCRCFYLDRNKPKTHRFKESGIAGTFVGINPITRCFIIIGEDNKVVETKQAKFDEASVLRSFNNSEALDITSFESALDDELLRLLKSNNTKSSTEQAPGTSSPTKQSYITPFMWVRHDENASCYQKSAAGGPLWSDVINRDTYCGDSGKLIHSEDIYHTDSSKGSDVHSLPISKRKYLVTGPTSWNLLK